MTPLIMPQIHAALTQAASIGRPASKGQIVLTIGADGNVYADSAVANRMLMNGMMVTGHQNLIELFLEHEAKFQRQAQEGITIANEEMAKAEAARAAALKLG